MNDEPDELDEREQQWLKTLGRERMPAPFVEDQTVKRLKQLNLINASGFRWRRNVLRFGIAATIAAAIFALGVFVASKRSPAPPVATSGPQFMFVLRAGTASSEKRSSEEIMSLVREYTDWASRLRGQGLAIDGEKLTARGQILQVVDGQSVSASASKADQDTIVGYFVLTARDYEQAMDIAKGCPHLRYGGFIEVRQIQQF